jgi:DNA mismatch repair protein MutH
MAEDGDVDFWKNKYETTEQGRLTWMRRFDAVRDALVEMVRTAPSGDELRLLCMGVNGPAMTDSNNANGRKLHAQCDALTKARQGAMEILEKTKS